MKNFTNQYQLTKTIRFELIPQGKTLMYIKEKGFLKDDQERAKNYQEVKKTIDDYHKDFIDKALYGLELDGLQEFANLYYKADKTDNEIKHLDKIRATLRKQIASRFSKHPNEILKKRYTNLFKKELIKQDLQEWTKDVDKIKSIQEFDKFTTYFTGFHENRKNMYSSENKSTAIAFRLIHENLPKFLDNRKVFRKIKEKYPDLDYSGIENKLESVLQGVKADEFFEIEHFNECLTQTGIDIYNTMLGGQSEEGQKKIQGLNECVNIYRQKNNLKKKDIPNLTSLYKQILSDRNTASFLPDSFENDREVLESVRKFFVDEIENWKFNEIPLLLAINALLLQLPEYGLDKVYLKNDVSLTYISNDLFGDWSIIGNALRHYYETEKEPFVGKKRTKKYDDEVEKYVSKSKQHSIADIENALWLYKNVNSEISEFITDHTICDYFRKFSNKTKDTKTDAEIETDFNKAIKNRYSAVKKLLNTSYPESKNLMQDTEAIEKLKSLLDAIKQLLWFVKPLQIGAKLDEKDEAFYNNFMELFDQLNKVTPLYDKTRNYLTRKPYSLGKYKLNFENSTLLDGWDVNKESDNTCILLLKDGLYYLAIMDKKYNKVFKDIPASDENSYQKVHYKLLPGANKMLPKVFFSKARIDEFNPGQELIDNYKNKSHKKGDTFDLNHCHQLINFFKSSIHKHPDWKNFEFRFSDTNTYNDLSDFYKEVAQQGYKITYQNVPDSYIDHLVQEGKIYLFQIYNKDFSPYCKGKPNLHTLYWKMLFDNENLKNVVYKLNGQAEVFYRKRSLNLKDTTIHIKGNPIENKNELNTKKLSIFNYDIVKNRRFTCDKFQFHVPITLNFKAEGVNNINAKVNQYLQNNPETHIIGIDRGERHLLYVSIIDNKGRIKGQFSFNEIISEHKGKKYKTNYHNLLNKKEEERKQARVNWGTIENIKELKSGYMSQVVHKITKLMVQFNAIIVMEDLNFGFKRGRQKVEKQVYQKFEKMLIDKLNYLVFKDKAPAELGGTLNALQLTNKFESFKKMGKQCGFVFYVPAWNTSKIDPATGFVNLFFTRYESVAKSQAFFRKFKQIIYNTAKDRFEFTFDYNDFTTKAEGTKTDWTVVADNCSRYKWNRKLNNSRGDHEELKVAEQMTELLGRYNIPFGSGENLKKDIVAQDKADFFKKLLYLFSTLVSLRHNNGKKGNAEEDKILSPVEPFFDSTSATEKQPMDADANGAYHIALKGLWVLDQINNTDMEKLNKPQLAISNKDWLNWVQKRPFEE